ncbi:hypothetical protein BOX15_Mlig007487g1, partial [Macrostomum lignano]
CSLKYRQKILKNSKLFTMDLGKVTTHFDALVKFHKTTSQFKTKAEEVAHVRGVVSKLQQALQAREKLHRDSLLRKANYAQSLVLTLQTVSDREVHLATASCILELLGQTKSGQRARIFVKLGGTQAVCQAIASEWRSPTPNEALLLQLHLVLAKLAPKDKRLATKARLCQCAPVVLSLLRHGLSTRGAESLLRLLRAYALSRQSSTSLGRHGAVQLLLRLLSESHRGVGSASTGASAAAAGRRQPLPGGPARRAAEALSQLTRARANASRAITGGAAATLVELLNASAVTTAAASASARQRQQQQRTYLLRAIVHTLRNVTASKAGRAAFHSAGGPASLYRLCLAGPASSAGELLNAGACIILRQSAPRACLPAPSLLSPYTPALLQLLVSSTSSAAAAVAVASDDSADAAAGAAAAAVNSDEDESSDDADVQKQQQPSDEFADDAAVGGADPRSAEELRVAYGHLEPELSDCCTCCPASTASLTPSPSLPSLDGLALGQPTEPASATEIGGRLSVSATSALLAPAAAQSFARSRSIGGWPEPSPATTSAASAPAAAAVRSVAELAITAGPELVSVSPPPHREPCDTRRSECAMELMLDDARRWIDPSDVLNRVVYDLDAIVAEQHQQHQPPPPASDEKLSPIGSGSVDHLTFESRFESGNLRRAIQIREREYDLLLCPDIGHRGQTQWFYFRLANVQPGAAYRFNVINCEKPNSQFNCGMRPLMYSSREAQLGRPHWLRVGTRVCYYRNHYQRAKQAGTKPYYTASFSIAFRHSGDICYLAYYVPYTYSRLMADLRDWRLVASRDASIAYHQQWLCQSLGGNRLPLLTVTAASASEEPRQQRPCVFISGRVHPGEANASWVVRGLVAHLLSPAVRTLRSRFVFKIAPMLNPDGVINGNHRCSLAVVDLNRTWLAPNATANPEIYHTKGLMSYLCSSGRRPVVYIDCHGHSRHNNVFMFGCSPSLSWLPDDRDNPGWLAAEPPANDNEARRDDNGVRPVSGGPGGGVWIEDPGYRELPRLLAQMAPAFAWRNCNFKVDRSKESTARVVAWRHLGILRAYTLEASYSCCDQGPYRGCHLGTRELEEMGARLGEAILRWAQGEAPGADPPLAQQPASAASSAAAGSGRAGRSRKVFRPSGAGAAAISASDDDDGDDDDDDAGEEEEDTDDNGEESAAAGERGGDVDPNSNASAVDAGPGGSGDCIIEDESVLLCCRSSFVREPEGENCSASVL